MVVRKRQAILPGCDRGFKFPSAKLRSPRLEAFVCLRAEVFDRKEVISVRSTW